MLQKCWPYGFSLIGDVSFESAAYVARYVMKKRKGDEDHIDPKTGKTNREHYMSVHPVTGEIFQLEPEFCLMSRGGEHGGIGKSWLKKYGSDTDKDFITVRGKKVSLPKYYDSILEQEEIIYSEFVGPRTPDDVINRPLVKERKARRKSFINLEDNSLERLAVKEKVKQAQTKTLTRDIEEI